ncbi:zinc metalloprotease HtpX [Melioribacteraceae bacterium 4301-Me]|uniref:zinc metalloprotease HtpX n=1 Tax=Pyranulibacter aquaticus TaxID=3163344 RepID=UPI00359B0F2F
MNSVKTVILMTAMMILFMIVGSMLGGDTGLIIAFIFSLMLNFGAYWFSDKVVLRMYGAREVTAEEMPQLYNIVRELSMKAELPMPRIYIIDNPTPNAFATGRNPQNSAVAVTTGIMKILNKDELEGVLSHELTHVKNRDILVSTIAATLVGTITFIARMAGWAAMFGGYGSSRDRNNNALADLALIILAPIAAVLLQLAISRSREYMADAGGAKISGKPLALASALEKLTKTNEVLPMKNAGPSTAHLFIVNPFSGKAIMKLFSTHPPIEDRIERLKEIASGKKI